MSELLPCPMCGCTHICRDFTFGRWYQISCPDCGLEIGEPSETEAIASWNRRTPRYTHRNGETEPPMEAGWYWFEGAFTSNPDGKWSYMLCLTEYEGKLDTIVSMDGVDPSTELQGRWWGPVLPPWIERPTE